MKIGLKLSLAAAVAGLGLTAASAASAAIYTLNPLPVTPATVSVAGVVDDNTKSKTPTTFTDDFEFTIASTYDTTLSGLFFIKTPAPNDLVTSATLTLFQGIPGAGTMLASTGLFNIDQSTGVYAYDLEKTLTSGVDYFLEAAVTVPGGAKGDYSISATAAPVSAAPEPGVWALMIAGIGAIGAALRLGRRRNALSLA